MQVVVLMGSDSDWSIVKDCCDVLKDFKITFEAHILSAHRSPDDLVTYVHQCIETGCKIFICAAGKAAHLAGTVAAHTSQPVIGIPLSSSMNGLDSLLSTVQMPSGVPVCTTTIDGATNAAILAIQILSLYDNALKTKLREYKIKQVESMREKDARLQQVLKGA